MKLLKFAGLSLLLLAGCAPVSQTSFDFNGIQKDHAVAYDIRTGEHWYNRLWASPQGAPKAWVDGWTARPGVRPLGAPTGIAVDSAGRLLIVEDRHKTLLMLVRETP